MEIKGSRNRGWGGVNRLLCLHQSRLHLAARPTPACWRVGGGGGGWWGRLQGGGGGGGCRVQGAGCPLQGQSPVRGGAGGSHPLRQLFVYSETTPRKATHYKENATCSFEGNLFLYNNYF